MRKLTLEEIEEFIDNIVGDVSIGRKGSYASFILNILEKTRKRDIKSDLLMYIKTIINYDFFDECYKDKLLIDLINEKIKSTDKFLELMDAVPKLPNSFTSTLDFENGIYSSKGKVARVFHDYKMRVLKMKENDSTIISNFYSDLSKDKGKSLKNTNNTQINNI